MPEQPLVIVPVTLHPIANTNQPKSLRFLYDYTRTCRNHLPKWCGGAHHPNNYEGADEPMRQDYTEVKNIYIV
ncbi:hypothetical protein [Sporosarcina sp. HYO08]|uniref:hypothetical protein n=1 Tax=Sporosarcina sp. HYO08 TaxID=1759557 RepID=UPI0007917054|nr:hypothetical protein [Sporosarcina sp. HYO08]KXH87540.1 hypothetical protein AU377_02955 [Sporosarcina sp. HYO08]